MIAIATVILLVYLVVTVGLGGMARARVDEGFGKAARQKGSSARLISRAILNDAGMPKTNVVRGWFKGWNSYDDLKNRVVLAPDLMEATDPGACAVAAMQAARAIVARDTPAAWRRRRLALRWSSALPGLGFGLGLLFLFTRRLSPSAAMMLVAAACAVSLLVYFVTLMPDMRAAMVAKKSVEGEKIFADSGDLALAMRVLDLAPLADLRGPLASLRWLMWHALPLSKKS